MANTSVCWQTSSGPGGRWTAADHNYRSPGICVSDRGRGLPPPCRRRTFPERLQDLYTLLRSDVKKVTALRALCDVLPDDLVNMSTRQSEEGSLSKKGVGEDLTGRIGILIFFRLLESLQIGKNTTGIFNLVRQVPSMLSNIPVLNLRPPCALKRGYTNAKSYARNRTTSFAGLAAEACPGDVTEAIMSAAENLLNDEHELSNKQQGDVLQTLVGLAVKRGSLAHCLRVVKCLICSAADGGHPIPGVGCYIKVCQV